jgi:anaerobic magnesium-protoporphyrin IX monomethyl ester cyclase
MHSKDLTLIQFTYWRDTLPLGALYLAHGLEKANIKFDLQVYPLYKRRVTRENTDKLYSFLMKSRGILAVGCWSDMLPFLLAALKKVKKKSPGRIIILGGIGPTEVAEEIMHKFDFIDFIIKGCGVAPLPLLIDKIVKGEKVFTDIDGLVYRNGKSVKSNTYNGFYLNSIMPDILPYHRLKDLSSYSLFYIRTSFGCPYRCTYCQMPCLSRGKVVYKDMQKVIEEIRCIKKVGKAENVLISIQDEAFITSRTRVIEFCNLLRAAGLAVPWTCYGRVDRVDAELLEIMSKSGCEEIFFGVESGSNRILKEIKKNFGIEKAVEILLLSRKIIKRVIASFMFLFPFETIDDFRQTLFFMAYLKSHNIQVQLHQLTPIKNSEIYIKYRKNLRLFYNRRGTFHPSLDAMPHDCIKLIKDNPAVFYYYYVYDFPDLKRFAHFNGSTAVPQWFRT